MLSEVALKFQSFEFFWISVFGIVIAGTLAGGDPLKGYIAGFLGLFIATIGQEPYYNYQRFAFGSTDLAGGIGLLPALVGAFGVAEVLQAMRGPAVKAVSSKIDSVIPRIEDVLKYWRTILRSGAIGTFIGILPGLGEDTAAWSSYAAARRASKEKEKFGKGSIEGLMAAETGESACVPGAIIPVLTLAVPGSAPAAVLMAAMLIHGLNPGPNLMLQTPEFFYQIIAMLVIADMASCSSASTLVRPLLWILLVPRERLMPVVFVLCVVGAYAITSRVFDIYVMLFFGLLGFVLRELKFPMAPLILGLVLGDLLEKNLTRGLVLSGGCDRPVLHPADERRARRHHDLLDPVVDPGLQRPSRRAFPAPVTGPFVNDGQVRSRYVHKSRTISRANQRGIERWPMSLSSTRTRCRAGASCAGCSRRSARPTGRRCSTTARR